MSAPIIKLTPKRKRYDGFFGFVVLLAAATLLSFIVAEKKPEVEKKYKYEDTLPGWVQKFNSMDTVKMVISDSDIPAVTRRYVIGILNKIQSDIVLQINPQIEADKKVADTLNKKPKQ